MPYLVWLCCSKDRYCAEVHIFFAYFFVSSLMFMFVVGRRGWRRCDTLQSETTPVHSASTTQLTSFLNRATTSLFQDIHDVTSHPFYILMSCSVFSACSGYCMVCAIQLEICPLCRKPISERLPDQQTTAQPEGVS